MIPVLMIRMKRFLWSYAARGPSSLYEHVTAASGSYHGAGLKQLPRGPGEVDRHPGRVTRHVHPTGTCQQCPWVSSEAGLRHGGPASVGRGPRPARHGYRGCRHAAVGVVARPLCLARGAGTMAPAGQGAGIPPEGEPPVSPWPFVGSRGHGRMLRALAGVHAWTGGWGVHAC